MQEDLVNTMRSYTVREVHELTGIPLSSIRKSIANGYLKAFVLRGCQRGYLVMKSDLEEWIHGMQT